MCCCSSYISDYALLLFDCGWFIISKRSFLSLFYFSFFTSHGTECGDEIKKWTQLIVFFSCNTHITAREVVVYKHRTQILFHLQFFCHNFFITNYTHYYHRQFMFIGNALFPPTMRFFYSCFTITSLLF